jgi:hypothetical protein
MTLEMILLVEVLSDLYLRVTLLVLLDFEM